MKDYLSVQEPTPTNIPCNAALFNAHRANIKENAMMESKRSVKGRREYAEFMAPQWLKIGDESKNLVNSTCKPDVYFKRYNLMLLNFLKLESISHYVSFRGTQPAKAVKLIYEKQETSINNFITRGIKHIVESYKQESTRKQKVLDFCDSVEDYYESLYKTNLDYINQLRQIAESDDGNDIASSNSGVSSNTRTAPSTYSQYCPSTDFYYKAELCGKITSGLYPHEILLLTYAKKYYSGKPIAKFWQSTYGVSDVPALLKSLENRGFIANGELTEMGESEINLNAWVKQFHPKPQYGISMCTMSKLMSQNPGASSDEVIFNELNRRLSLCDENHDDFIHMDIKQRLADFFGANKRYDCAIWAISEVLYYSINVVSTQFDIDDRLLINQAPIDKLKVYLLAENMSIEKYLELFDNVMATMPAQGRVLSLHDACLLITASLSDNNSLIGEVYSRANTLEVPPDDDEGDDEDDYVYYPSETIPSRPKNEYAVHIILFFLTCGIGNILYWLYIRSKQQEWDKKYRS